MKNLIYLLLISFIISCNTSSHNSDKATVNNVLNDFISAVENKEFSKIEELIGDDFVIYENGLIWTFDEFSLKLEEYDSVKINYNLSNLHFIVDKKTAHAQFHNKGVFEYSDTTITLYFIESATFTKENNNWKINFYHSTHLK